MTDLPDTRNDTSVGPDRESTAGTPRWVKVFGIIALVVILLFVVVMLTGGGGGNGHGPGQHEPSGDAGGNTPQSITEGHIRVGGDLGDHRPPSGISGYVERQA